MFETDYAYSERTKEYSKISTASFIGYLFEHTAEDGTLIVPERPYKMIDDEAGTKWMRCFMNWTDEDVDALRKEFRALWGALLELSDEHPRLGKMAEDNTEVLSPDLLKVWDRYIRDLDDGRFERDIQRSVHRLSVDCKRKEAQLAGGNGRKSRKSSVLENLDYRDEKIFVRWRHSPQIKKAIANRFGDGPFGFDLCIRVKRLYYLMVLDDVAPNYLYSREQKRVAQYLALNKFCTKVESFETKIED